MDDYDRFRKNEHFFLVSHDRREIVQEEDGAGERAKKSNKPLHAIFDVIIWKQLSLASMSLTTYTPHSATVECRIKTKVARMRARGSCSCRHRHNASQRMHGQRHTRVTMMHKVGMSREPWISPLCRKRARRLQLHSESDSTAQCVRTGWLAVNEHTDEFCSDCVFSFRVQTLVRFTSLDLCSLSSLHDLRRLENQHFSGISSLYRHRCRCRRCWGSYSQTHHTGSTVAHWTLRTIGHFCYRCLRIFRFWIRTIRKSASSAFNLEECIVVLKAFLLDFLREFRCESEWWRKFRI